MNSKRSTLRNLKNLPDVNLKHVNLINLPLKKHRSHFQLCIWGSEIKQITIEGV